MDIGINRRTRGLDRAFEILDFLRETRKPARPNEIAVGMDAPKSTTYELVNLLLKAGILEYADKEGRVFLGRKLYFLGLAYQTQFDLTRECRAYLDHLAETTRETSQFCMLDGEKYTVAMMKEGARPFRISSDVGERIPIPWTASGRLLVSHMSDAEIIAFIPQGRLHPAERLGARHGSLSRRSPSRPRRRILLLRLDRRQFHPLLRRARPSGRRHLRRDFMPDRAARGRLAKL